MLRNKLAINLMSFLVYSILTFLFAYAILNAGFLEEQLNELKKVFEGETGFNIILFIITILSLLAIIVEYMISKFLVFMFFPNIKNIFYLVTIPKIIISILNISIINFFVIDSLVVFHITAFLGSIIIMGFHYHVNKSKSAAIIFSIPFLLDSMLTLLNTI